MAYLKYAIPEHTMTIQEAQQQLLFQLFHIYEEREARNIADLVMEHVTEWKRIDRVINKSVPLSIVKEKQLAEFTAKLLDHTPVQYVLHESWFSGLKFYVDENVLIPRPETEELVDWICTESSTGMMLDIGTGSGCIPVSIKKKLPIADIHACDVSGSALIVAQKNANENKTPIQFHQLDFLDPEQRKSLPSFDIIVSNPPYIPQKDKPEMHKNVLNHEPHIALFVEDDDPLIFYKAIASFATDHLKKDGAIYMEIHERLGRDVLRLFNESGFTKTILRKDLQEKDRMVKAMR